MVKKTDEILRESEIRPDYLKKGQAERFANDIQRLLAQRDRFVHVSCPACGSGVSSHAFEKYELSYVSCSNCDTTYINPRPTPDILEMYYSESENYQYWNKFIFPASEKVRREKIFQPRAQRIVEICRRSRTKTDVILEVGAGFGTFCEELIKTGLFRRVIGVEPTPDLAETCRKRGIEVIEKPIEQVDLDESSINVVAGFEVIEHLFSPRDFLVSCAKLLSPEGLIILTCPNVRGFDIQVLKDLSDAVDVEHLNYFNTKSLSHLLEICGFKVLEVSTPGKLDAELVRKKALGGEYDLSTQPFLKQILIDEWDRIGVSFQQFLQDSQLSSHMWIVGQKP